MMLFSTNKKTLSSLALISASALLGACNGGSSSSSLPQAEITSDRVTSRIDTSVANVANCEKSTTQVMLSAISGQQIQDIMTVSRALSEDSGNSVSPQAITIRPSADVGSCAGHPGSVSVSSEHSNGDTRYELIFDAYCTTGPEGDTSLTGTVVTTEDGTPTATGPMIKGTDLSMNNLAMQYEDATGQAQTALVSITGARTDYGLPAIGGSDTPTESNPNLSSIRSVKVDVETTGEVHELRNLSVSRFGDNTATVAVSSGVYVTPTRDTVDISTSETEPLIIDVANGEVTDGTIELTGSNDSSATIAASTGSRVMELSVNGVALSDEVDCSNTDTAVKEVVGLLLSRLPIY